MKPLHIFQLITFLSAFLLFQIELIIGKVFLPNFGGSYWVWGSCIVFFQAVLLLAYKYAQVVTERWGIHKYRLWHCCLAMLPFVVFPGKNLPFEYAQTSLPMTLEIFWQLGWAIGLVFFVLSTTSVIWQVWLSSSKCEASKNPYALFAVSNLGSFAALISYPLVFELFLTVDQQVTVWRVLYVIFVVLQWVAWKTVDLKDSRVIKEKSVPLDKKVVYLCLCYSAVGVMMFLSVTNIMTAEIAPIPLLWVMPLVVYLLSFVLNFKRKPWCPKWMVRGIHHGLGLGVLYFFLMKIQLLPVLFDFVVLFVLMFWICMFVQYKIFEMRPKDDARLAEFYFHISLGSFLGGIIVTWIIPLLSTAYLEYFCAFITVAIALYFENPVRQWRKSVVIKSVLLILLLVVGRTLIIEAQFFGLGICIAVFIYLYDALAKDALLRIAFILVVMILIQPLESIWYPQNIVYRHRNYYGITSIENTADTKIFWHGTTLHGAQYLDDKRSHKALSYYGVKGPVGEILTSSELSGGRIGVIGLGVGTLATYLKANQIMDFYEIDPDVVEMANEHFTFVSNSLGVVNNYIGDGRILLEEQTDRKYDVLVVDAFSGDSIPMHLLTREALDIYRKSLTEKGVIVFHVSNRYIQPEVPLSATGLSMGAHVFYKYGKSTEDQTGASSWMAVTWNDSVNDILFSKLKWKRVTQVVDGVRPWTDQYSSVLPYMMFNGLLELRNIQRK